MAIRINQDFLSEVYRNYIALYRERPRAASAYLREEAKRANINVQTLHRHLKLRVRNPRTPDPRLSERHAKLDIYGMAVWDFIRSNTRDDHSPSITTAFRVLQDQGLIPSEVTRAQVYAAIDRMNLKMIAQPISRRFERDKPMNLWQVDFSKSLYFKHSGDKEVTVLHPNFTKKQSDGYSIWLGVAIDDCTRVMFVHYFLSKGESTTSTQAFLAKAFEAKPNQKLLQGLPEAIYVDRGSAWLSQTTRNGLGKLGVNMIVGADEVDSQGTSIRRSNKKARGKVERAIRTIKEKMEQEFLFKLGEGRTISLAQLNVMTSAWVENWNDEIHMTEKTSRKWTLFEPALATVRYPPEDALSLFTQSDIRKVVRRLINVGKGVSCIAPSFLRDGDSVEVLKGNGGYYVYHKGNKYKLEFQVGTKADQLEKAGIRTEILNQQALKSEADDELIRDHFVNRRFAEELGMSLNEIPANIWDEISPFFDQDQTLGEIKAFAKDVRSRLNPVLPDNVILLPMRNANQSSMK